MNRVGLRLAYAGTPELAAIVMGYLFRQEIHKLAFVITQPDKPAGRGRKLIRSPVKLLAQQHDLPVRQPQRPSEFDPDNALMHTDVLIVAAYGMILPAGILSRPRLGCINVHTSLLPRWRGAAPIQRAIQSGDNKTGITIMQMDTGLDTGDILLQCECAICPGETAGSLHDKLADLGGVCLLETLDLLAQQSLTPSKQDSNLATYAHKISKHEAIIDWRLSAVELERTIRAFNPAPVAHTKLQGVAMRVWESEVIPLTTATAPTPGTIVDFNKDGITVATIHDALRIKRLQLPGKKILTAREFFNGHPGLLQPGRS